LVWTLGAPVLNLDVAIELIAFASRSKLPATAPQAIGTFQCRVRRRSVLVPSRERGVSSRPPGGRTGRQAPPSRPAPRARPEKAEAEKLEGAFPLGARTDARTGLAP